MNSGFVLDDIPESCVWLVSALEKCFPGIKTASAGNLQEARAWFASQPAPDIALIDLGLPDGNGVGLIQEINRRALHTLCIVASIYDDDRHIFPALRAGAQGYILKDQSHDDIVPLLQGIAAGRPPLSPGIARKILGSFRGVSPVPSDETLTRRESDVLALIAKGMTLAETAALLGISRNTVDGHVKEIYRKLNICSRAEAALSAQHLGLM